MINALIVVYRESFEALLIVGLLYSFLIRKHASRYAFRFMGLGVLIGLGLSGLLAYLVYTIESELGGFALEMFQFFMMVLAVVLITQMCLWMRIHSHRIKSEIETNASKTMEKGQLLGLASLTAIAVAREGSETVIFLYGLIFDSAKSGNMFSFSLFSIAGLILGILTWMAFQKGFSYFKQKTFFTFSSSLLFVTAGSMIVSISSKIIEFNWVQFGRDQMWDSSWLLSEDSMVGSILKIVTGYKSQPTMFTVGLYITYWLVVISMLYLINKKSAIFVKI